MAPKHDSKTDSGTGRWSIEEVKNLLLRPFSSNSNSRKSHERDSSMSFGGLRWSLEEIKDKFFRSSMDKTAEGKDKGKNKRKQLTPEERQARRTERIEARKQKKSKREKERRGNVNGLFDQLGTMLKVDTANTAKGQRLSILDAAVTKLKAKENGGAGGETANRSKLHKHLEDSSDDDDDDDERYEGKL